MVKTGPDETVAAMEQQGEILRRRILELEAQQRELEDQLYGPQAPPDYASEPSARSTQSFLEQVPSTTYLGFLQVSPSLCSLLE